MKARVAYRKLPAAAFKAVEQRRAVVCVAQIIRVFKPPAHEGQHLLGKPRRHMRVLHCGRPVKRRERLVPPTQLLAAYRQLVQRHCGRLFERREISVCAFVVARLKRGRGAVIADAGQHPRVVQRRGQPLRHGVVRLHVFNIELVAVAVSDVRPAQHHQPRPPLSGRQRVGTLEILNSGGVAPPAFVLRDASPVAAQR